MKRQLMMRMIGMMAALWVGVGSHAMAESFYKQPNLFNFWHPNETSASQSIDRFGPVGMSLELRLPPYQMYVGKIEEGSPAEATGKLVTGQRIESINGQVLKDIDPRIQLARIIAAAEATDGKIKLMIKAAEEAEEVVVQLPVLGAYSKTWPLNCKKSDKIVRNMAHWVKTEGGYDLDTQGWKSLNGFGMLFLLSTGDESDLEHVRGWIKRVVEQYKHEEKILLKPWVFGSAAIPLAEYYLRTGDKSILPVIQKLVRHVEGTMFNGAWSGRGGLVFGYMVGGHMNAAGIHGPTFLMLAKECGVEVNESIMLESLRQFYRFAGKGSVPYGDGFPETYFIDNGKTGALAFTMAAAAALTPRGEQSVYARARDVSALRGFYGTNYMLTGHTGGGIGEVWRGPAMGFLYEKEPAKYRAFMDGRLWHLEMSRRFNGSFGILNGTSRYDTPSTWGQMMALQYTIPRKTLRLSGAPRGKWSKPYALPERPWGTAADDDFCEITPAVDADGRIPAFDDSIEGGPINGVERLFRATEDTKALGLQYCLHPDHEMRREVGAGYVKRNEQDEKIVAMLKHKDARVRRAALSVIHSVHKGTHVLPAERLTDEMVGLVIAMVNDPEASWWCVENALRVMSVLPKEKTAPHLDRLLYFLGHEEWWLQHAALQALAPLAVDDATYARILPKIGDMVVNNVNCPATGPIGGLTKRLATASPKVQAAAVVMLSKSYTDFPADLQPPAGDAAADQLKGDMKKYVVPVSLRTIAYQLVSAPGGFSALYQVAKARHPEEILPYKQKYLWADYASFSPDVKAALKPIVLEQLVPEFVSRNLGTLRSELTKGGSAHCRLTDLSSLYRKAGVTDYEWQNFGPDRSAMKWHYYSFDPPEKLEWVPRGNRSRKMTMPKGMDRWNSSEFDPVSAGWKKGLAPFGQVDGRAQGEGDANRFIGCNNPVCRCGDQVNTLWEKEVLMIRGTFTFPPMREGYSYRILFGGRSHVGLGNGPTVSINGKQIASGRAAPRRGQGGRARGALISKSMMASFQGQDVTLSAICHLNKHHRTGNIHGFLNVWLEEMKNPPVSDELAWDGLKFISLQSSEWQQDQDSDEGELSTEEGLFRFDGTFVANESVLGSWKPIGKVAKIDDFKPGAEVDPALPRYRSITLKENGFTDSSERYWSGDTLMQISGREAGALKMKTRTIDGEAYLFIETGGFTFYHERQHYKHPRTWNSPWFVLKR
ncbi:MAG: PDZ domain-containing protein [Verrucomicrobia bacterium]|jgi:hypothetical protein|nr:PDZ domain-containing protein [Verrucomicrobiota bacterium]MBT7068804.1 PDZ domain-containing protein [Verrucomicrobiota bacterium]MBT7700448.1 PDZ domain-containing protein [Verrucomicrobiota bacterium]